MFIPSFFLFRFGINVADEGDLAIELEFLPVDAEYLANIRLIF